MRPLERHRFLLDLLAERGDLSLHEACRELRVSEATMRRDFSLLAQQGRVQKLWGGIRKSASTLPDGSDMVPSTIRETVHADEKEQIAAAASRLLQEEDVILVDGGTTTLHLARHLADKRLRIITNSILIAHRLDALRRRPQGAEVFLSGGLLYPGSGLLVGPDAAETLSRYHAKWAVLSVGGLDCEGGTNTNQLVVESERAMIRSAEKVMVLADRSKWERKDMVRAFAWDEIDVLVTDATPQIPLPQRLKIEVP